MAIFKCKICGGSLDIADGNSVAVCEYCSTKQTVPTTKDEVVANLFNRANNLRLKCEFDKAEQVYEKILDVDNTDAEAHWGLVLCKYGIEYVEDSKTNTKIPTCHRTLYDTVLTDIDYITAIENSDAEQKELYEAEAKVIDELQKNILNIVNNEEPFDVFICYKETDDDGKRTVDSSISNDIYHQLTQEGFKVFYAPITLEDKLGYEYEPYIFAALNSAKVMLVVGTKPEYFDSVWVRNEWSRYLKLMKAERSKLLIPCYKDMDAYELPDEFAHLQAQDMGKIGFISDVIRGLRKVINNDEQVHSSSTKKKKVKNGKIKNIAENFKRERQERKKCCLAFPMSLFSKSFYFLSLLIYLYFGIKILAGLNNSHDESIMSLYIVMGILMPSLVLVKAIRSKMIAVILQGAVLSLYILLCFTDIPYMIECGFYPLIILSTLLTLIWFILIGFTRKIDKSLLAKHNHIISITPAVILAMIIVLFFENGGTYYCNYQLAKRCYRVGEYELALEILEQMPDYKDTNHIINAVNYDKAELMYTQREYSEAIITLRTLGEFPDSKNLKNKIKTEMNNIASESINPELYTECTLKELYENPQKYHRKKVCVTALKVLCNFEDKAWSKMAHYNALLCDSDDTNDGSSTTGNTWYGYYSDYLLPYDIPYVGVQAYGSGAPYISEHKEMITVYGTFTYNPGAEGDRYIGEPHVYNIVADCCIE